MASRAPMPSAIGNASLVATAPAATRTSMICSVPYAVELIASEENTASATTLRSRSATSREVASGGPSSRSFHRRVGGW